MGSVEGGTVARHTHRDWNLRFSGHLYPFLSHVIIYPQNADVLDYPNDKVDIKSCGCHVTIMPADLGP